MFTAINNSLSTPYDHSSATEILTFNPQHHQQLYMLPLTACVWQHCNITCTPLTLFSSLSGLFHTSNLTL